MNSVANLSLAAQSRVGDIAFIDLKAQQVQIREAVEKRLLNILDHGRYIAGPEISELEEVLVEKTGAACAVSCASGTAALIIPMLAKGIGPGDAVFTPAFTYNATANAILLAGATPVFVDIDPYTFNIDPEDLENKIASVQDASELRPSAVIAVDLFGSPADYAAIEKLCSQFGLSLLADAAQSYGGAIGGKAVGAIAPVTSTSFFPGKALGAYGDAGAIFSMNPDDAEIFQSIRWHGTDAARKESVRVGFNGRMDSFQAAVLLEKLAIFDQELMARREIAAIYDERLKSLASLQKHYDGAQSGCAYYSLCIDDRDRAVERLRSLGVPTAIYYNQPLHRMAAFSQFASPEGLPVTERVSGRIFSLPMHPYLTPEQVDYICDAVHSAVSA